MKNTLHREVLRLHSEIVSHLVFSFKKENKTLARCFAERFSKGGLTRSNWGRTSRDHREIIFHKKIRSDSVGGYHTGF